MPGFPPGLFRVSRRAWAVDEEVFQPGAGLFHSTAIPGLPRLRLRCGVTDRAFDFPGPFETPRPDVAVARLGDAYRSNAVAERRDIEASEVGLPCPTSRKVSSSGSAMQ